MILIDYITHNLLSCRETRYRRRRWLRVALDPKSHDDHRYYRAKTVLIVGTF